MYWYLSTAARLISLSHSLGQLTTSRLTNRSALDDFDQEGESLVLALFTHGATDAYSSSSGTLHSGSDVEIADNLTVNRVRILNFWCASASQPFWGGQV